MALTLFPNRLAIFVSFDTSLFVQGISADLCTAEQSFLPHVFFCRCRHFHAVVVNRDRVSAGRAAKRYHASDTALDVGMPPARPQFGRCMSYHSDRFLAKQALFIRLQESLYIVGLLVFLATDPAQFHNLYSRNNLFGFTGPFLNHVRVAHDNGRECIQERQ